LSTQTWPNSAEVHQLISQQVDVNCRNEADDSTPLIAAMLENSPSHQAIVEALLAVPTINVDATTSSLIFPLAIACADNNEQYIRQLILQGARTTRRTVGGTPLVALAAAHCHRPCIELLVNNGSNVGDKSDGGTTALMACCKRTTDLNIALEVAQYLLQFGMVRNSFQTGF